jgi:3-hydroxyisobutyrate dehydrogenase-like beta-hydroxyacid dehydrogenase
MNVGFIGLGTMGAPMARNLLRAGHRLAAFDVRAEAVNALAADGAVPATSIAEVCGQADFVFTSLPGNAHLIDVYLGTGGIAESIRKGSLCIDTSTVTPTVTRRAGSAVQARGGLMLDASLARTEKAAIEGTLSIMVGGAAEAFERALPLLQAIGSEINHCGPLGCGNVVKLVNNQIVLTTLTTLAEAMTVGVKAGVDPTVLLEVLKKSSADSFVLRNLVEPSVMSGNFRAGSFPLAYARKDLAYASELAEELAIPTFQASAARQLYDAAIAMGYTDDFCTVVFRVIEAWAGVEVRS